MSAPPKQKPDPRQPIPILKKTQCRFQVFRTRVETFEKLRFLSPSTSSSQTAHSLLEEGGQCSLCSWSRRRSGLHLPALLAGKTWGTGTMPDLGLEGEAVSIISLLYPLDSKPKQNRLCVYVYCSLLPAGPCSQTPLSHFLKHLYPQLLLRECSQEKYWLARGTP